MLTVLTQSELAAKGISKRDVAALLKGSETRVNFYAKQYARNGYKCSSKIQAAWDQECARWDHLKATLDKFQ